MKMPEKHDLLAAILAAKEQRPGNPGVAMAYLRGRYNAVRFTKTVIGATMCAIIEIARDLRLRRTMQKATGFERAFIGYIGTTDSIGSLIKRFAAKKPE